MANSTSAGDFNYYVQQTVCPTCGKCPTCGSQGWSQPHVTWTTTPTKDPENWEEWFQDLQKTYELWKAQNGK